MKFLFSVEKFFSTREEKFCISKRPCNVLFIIQTPMKYQTTLLNYFYGLKGAVYYEAIAAVIFSHVKMSSFCAKTHLVFHWFLMRSRYENATPNLCWVFCALLGVLCN